MRRFAPRAGRQRWATVVCALLVVLALPSLAAGHVERASYWPDPAPDAAVTPAAGGRVPVARSLVSALDSRRPGVTRVVCQPYSMRVLTRSIRNARRHGYNVRPTVHRGLSAGRARDLLRINRALAKRCAFHDIQPAVTASHNNDRVVIMPGIYTEQKSRDQPTHDPRCAKYNIANDKGSSGALSYAFQLHCPNDANLIAVMGREQGPGNDPAKPREDRHGIPNLGACIRCNLQIEGSGVNADDVVIDAGRAASGNHAPIGAKKDVGIRADRADGFVLRDVTVRHAGEHAVYVLETDGYLLDRFKTFYSGEYGVLTFVEDHGVMQNCEAVGNGDSGLYPGAGAETGAQRAPGTEFRYSQEVRLCDSHHNSSGYSGTDGNATHIDHNNFYDNALGFTTDVFTAPGHPGFPQDSDLVEDNNFYSNNFNPYVAGSDVKPSVPVPVGTGLWIAGGNNNVVRNNHFFNNWRRGAMLFAAPDAAICGPAIGKPVTGCDPAKFSTSYNNRFYGNVMGVAPGGAVKPNGVDFWWDGFVGNRGNCWYANVGAPGVSVTGSPSLPDCSNGTKPESSVGIGDVANERELVGCLAGLESGGYNPSLCPWFKTPPRPGLGAASVRRSRVRARSIAEDPVVRAQVCRLYAAAGDASACALAAGHSSTP